MPKLDLPLTDREVYLLRRALHYWIGSDKIIPADDGGALAEEMTKLQAYIELTAIAQGLELQNVA